MRIDDTRWLSDVIMNVYAYLIQVENSNVWIPTSFFMTQLEIQLMALEKVLKYKERAKVI